MGVKARFSQMMYRVRRAHAMMAHHHERQVFGQLGQAAGELIERNQDAALDLGRREFLGLADIKEEVRRLEEKMI